MSHLTRRQALVHSLFGAVGLRAFATGIPASLLLNPRRALADGSACLDPSKAQFLILSTSGGGDPMNCNVPGTYDNPNIAHAPTPSMAATPLTLAGQAHRAAAAWATLPQAVLDRTAFMHHATYTVVHGDEPKVLGLNGAVGRNEMFVSLLASQLGPCLGTIQAQPLCIGAQGGDEALAYQGRTQPVLNPSALSSVLTMPTGPLADLQKLRDSTLDSLNAWFKTQGVPAQQNFIDRYANSQAQLRAVSGAVLNTLGTIKDNTPASQIAAAVALIQMNVSPVVSVHLPFGGDNHEDNDLANESNQTSQSVANLAALMTQLSAAGLQDRCTFMALNVFGRTLSRYGTQGRNHNANHHCTLLIGKNVRGGVYGGLKPMDDDFGATGIDAQSGRPTDGGDIPFRDTFAAVGKTIGRSVGVAQDFLDANITGGKPITAALSGV